MTTAVLEPIFCTERLRVFAFNARATELNRPRTVYNAFEADNDLPRVILVATAWINDPPYGVPYVDYLEVVEDYRRSGLATEFRLGLEQFIGRALWGTGATPEGNAFLAHFGVVREKHGIPPPRLEDS